MKTSFFRNLLSSCVRHRGFPNGRAGTAGRHAERRLGCNRHRDRLPDRRSHPDRSFSQAVPPGWFRDRDRQQRIAWHQRRRLERAGAQTYNASYWFFRYKADGTFASIARISDTIQLGQAGEFTSAGTVLDFDATGTLISTGCFVHSAKRLSLP